MESRNHAVEQMDYFPHLKGKTMTERMAEQRALAKKSQNFHKQPEGKQGKKRDSMEASNQNTGPKTRNFSFETTDLKPPPGNFKLVLTGTTKLSSKADVFCPRLFQNFQTTTTATSQLSSKAPEFRPMLSPDADTLRGMQELQYQQPHQQMVENFQPQQHHKEQVELNPPPGLTLQNVASPQRRNITKQSYTKPQPSSTNLDPAKPPPSSTNLDPFHSGFQKFVAELVRENDPAFKNSNWEENWEQYQCCEKFKVYEDFNGFTTMRCENDSSFKAKYLEQKWKLFQKEYPGFIQFTTFRLSKDDDSANNFKALSLVQRWEHYQQVRKAVEFFPPGLDCGFGPPGLNL